MLRLSRIECPRGNLFAFALLIAALLTFGAIAEAGSPQTPAGTGAEAAVAASFTPASCMAARAAGHTS